MAQQYILSGYTRREGRGLYEATFHEDGGYFEDPVVIQDLTDSTYVTLSQKRDLLFSIHKDQGKGALIAFRRSPEGPWIELDRLTATEASGCHLSYRESSQTIYVSNYGLGQLDVYQLKDDQLSHIQQVIFQGSGPRPEQDQSHIHFAQMYPTDEQLYVCDLGADKVYRFIIDTEGLIKEDQVLSFPAGTGPRHMTFHPFKPYAYVLGELSNSTFVVSISEQGDLEILEEHLNIPEEFVETSNSAAIRISSDGRFLYTSTRYYNEIVVWKIKESGDRIEKIQSCHTMGQVPRDFILDESERYLIIPHQDSDHVSIFSRNSEDGRVDFLNNQTYVPECVCVAHA